MRCSSPGSAAQSRHRQREADGKVARPALSTSYARAVRGDERVRRPLVAVEVLGVPGGNRRPSRSPCNGTMLGSLIVHAIPIPSPRCATATSAEAGEPVDDRGVGPAAVGRSPARRREVVERDDREQVAARGRRRGRGVVVERARWRTRRPRARCVTTRSRTGTRRSRARAGCRDPRVAPERGRTRRPTARRTACRARAPTPTSRCSSCRPRPGGRRSRCPRGTRQGRSSPCADVKSSSMPCTRVAQPGRIRREAPRRGDAARLRPPSSSRTRASRASRRLHSNVGDRGHDGTCDPGAERSAEHVA